MLQDVRQRCRAALNGQTPEFGNHVKSQKRRVELEGTEQELKRVRRDSDSYRVEVDFMKNAQSRLNDECSTLRIHNSRLEGENAIFRAEKKLRDVDSMN